METRIFQTPQKTSKKSSMAGAGLAVPMQQCTPQNSRRSSSVTPKSVIHGKSGNFSMLPIVDTPPSRAPKVVNPFESGLTERLHLPLICSPSLFQRTTTPQHSSTQFEWTIEEVSSLGPANVEAHETQFQATPDPDLEAKAQAAISTYFKEQIIVPSPVECSLRNRKIVLENIISNDSPPVRSGRRIRDGVAQTIMSIPPRVVPEIEMMLKQFFTYTADQQQSPTVSCDITLEYEAQDISLRRKLFGVPLNYRNEQGKESSGDMNDDETDSHNNMSDIHSEHSPPPKTPDLQTEPLPLRGFGTPFGNNSFGELSPISRVHSNRTSPRTHALVDAFNNTVDDIVDDEFNFGNDCNVLKSTQQSPPPSNNGSHQSAESVANQQNQSLYISTPDRSTAHQNAVINMSIDGSFRKTVTRQGRMNSSRNLFHNNEMDNSASDQSFIAVDEDEMQVSQLSAKSTGSSSSSQHSDTPMRRRNRSASRKNLSQSFSCPVTDDEDEMDCGFFIMKKFAIASGNKSSPEVMDRNLQQDQLNQQQFDITCTGHSTATERSVFYRTDSGFNEMNTQDESKLHNEIENLKRNVAIIEADVSMTS